MCRNCNRGKTVEAVPSRKCDSCKQDMSIKFDGSLLTPGFWCYECRMGVVWPREFAGFSAWSIKGRKQVYLAAGIRPSDDLLRGRAVGF